MEFVEEVTETLEDMNVDPEVQVYSIRLDELEELDWEDHEEIVLMARSSSSDEGLSCNENSHCSRLLEECSPGLQAKIPEVADHLVQSQSGDIRPILWS